MAPVVLVATGGQPQLVPVGRSVAAAGEAQGIDESLEIMRRVAMAGLPVGGNPPRDPAEAAGGSPAVGASGTARNRGHHGPGVGRRYAGGCGRQAGRR